MKSSHNALGHIERISSSKEYQKQQILISEQFKKKQQQETLKLDPLNLQENIRNPDIFQFMDAPKINQDLNDGYLLRDILCSSTYSELVYAEHPRPTASAHNVKFKDRTHYSSSDCDALVDYLNQGTYTLDVYGDEIQSAISSYHQTKIAAIADSNLETETSLKVATARLQLLARHLEKEF